MAAVASQLGTMVGSIYYASCLVSTLANGMARCSLLLVHLWETIEKSIN
jgi:hypothetical protein